MKPGNIPGAMLERSQWIGWESEERNGKQTKLPKAPWNHGGNVAANDPENWTSFDTARNWAEKLPSLKLGFVFAADGPFVGIDLDDCYKMEDGERVQLSPSAKDIIGRVESYVELSPSGTGLHIICKGELDNALKNDDRGVEIYDRDRFFTVTGDIHASSTNSVYEAQDALDFLMDEYMVHQDEAPSNEPDMQVDGAVTTDGDHPLYELSVTDVYPALSHGDNIEHPVHGSSTGHNFKIHDGEPTAVCWRGEHQYGRKQGCVLCAWHLLAMEGTGIRDCSRIRSNYPDDDSLVFAAWEEAYRQGLVTGETPPWRAVNHIAKEYLGDMSGGGKGAWATFRAACHIICSEYDIPVEIDSPDICEYDGCEDSTDGDEYCSVEHKIRAIEDE